MHKDNQALHGHNENTKMAKEKTCFLSRHFMYFPRMLCIRQAVEHRLPVEGKKNSEFRMQNSEFR